MATGLRLVRKELGPDALILSTKTVKNGKLGLLGKSTIEITAAIDQNWASENETAPKPASTTKKTKKSLRKTSQGPVSPSHINTQIGGDDISIDYGSDESGNDEMKDARQLLTSQFSPAVMPPHSEGSLQNEVSELKNLVHLLAGQIVEPGSTGPPPDTNGNPLSINSASGLRERLIHMKTSADPVVQLLSNHGILGETAATIAEFSREQLSENDLEDGGKIRRLIIKTIENLLEVKPPIFDSTQKQKRIALIGPTGVGKTTTLAKLAANYLSSYSRSIALITIDTYRIAAVEQLKVYGEIMHLPVDVVISPEQLEKALNRHADKSLILIDTAGRSPKDSLSIQELANFLRSDFNIEKHLVLSAATRENELLDAIKLFDKVGVDRTIFTKVDECTRNGVILNVQIHNRAPLSYIANGQRVPEDLLQINKRSVAELIMSHHQEM